MNNQIKVAVVIGIAIVVAVACWIYFSPYQTCVRANAQVLVDSRRADSAAEATRMAQVNCGLRR